MKSKTIIIGLLLLSSTLLAQEKTSSYVSYTIDTGDDYYVDALSYSTTYYDGKVWFFQLIPWEICFTSMSIDEDGHINNMSSYHKIGIDYLGFTTERLNSAVFNQKLYLFYYNDLDPIGEGSLHYTRITTDGGHHVHKSTDLNITPNHKHKMSAVVSGDTLYLFYVNIHEHIQYIKGLPKDDSDEINWLSNDPITLVDSTGAYLVSYGNVAAATYFTPENEEKILVVYPSKKTSSTQNDIIFYSGTGDNFEYHHKKPSSGSPSGDNSAYYVSLMQGTLKGAHPKAYVMQTVYTTKGEGPMKRETVRMFRNEFDLTNGTYEWGWEELPKWGGTGFTMAAEFMEFYVPDGNTKEIRKFMYLLYNDDWASHAKVLQWESDLLKMTGSVTEFSPEFLKEELWHLICVVEGPPPFVLNGWTMEELWDGNKYPPSSFIYGQESTHTVGSNTVYKKTIEASGGFGPINGGFKRSMQHNNHDSDTDITTLSVITPIKPPVDSAESTGLMWSFYDAPSLTRTQWRLHDYNGDTLYTDHSLFLFNFTQAQLKVVKTPFTEYSKSPRLNDIYSYEGRNVAYFPGVQSTIQTELAEDIAGGVEQTQTIDFDTLYTNTTTKTKTINVGIDAKYKIFSLQAGYKAEVEYTTENNTENNHGFQLTYNNPIPKAFHDTSNVLSFNAVAYLMNTTDSSAYFLPEGFKNYRPLFITWEVNSIQHGEYLESVNENIANIDKYNFSNYPNPCSFQSIFTYSLSNKSFVKLLVYNAFGQKITMPVNEYQIGGKQQLEFNTSTLSNGVYYYRLMIDKDVISGKMIKKSE